MTAEGDNRVLMTKIVKDMMTNIAKKKSSLPQMMYCPKYQIIHFDDITHLNTLIDLLKFREITLFNTLLSTMKRKST